MRRVLLAFLLFTGYAGTAQDLANKIPEKAFAVASIKSDQLFRLFSIGEFNSSVLGQKLLGDFSQRTGGDYKSIEDAGINLSSTIYYYHQKTDSINYNCLLIPLSDANKLEKLFNDTTRAKIKQQGNTKILATSDKNLIMWNNEVLYVAHGSLVSTFFDDSLAAARYGIKPLSYDEDEYTDEPMVDTAATTIDTSYTDNSIAMPEEVPEVDTAISTDEIAIEETEYDKASRLQQAVKDSIAATWMIPYSLDILNKNHPSVLNNASYLRSLDKDALGSFWLADLPGLYTGFLPYSFMKYGNMMSGYGSINARLYMDKEHMRITGEMALDAEKAESYKHIYDKKLNKKFLQYIKSDSLIGFMSYAFDTESYLKELPKVFSQGYGAFSDEIDLGGELISLMLDEKAIAKVIKGDALILMTNISSKETTYETYVYDENYERKDTTETKMETIPDLLCMFSSDDMHLIEKLLKYGITKHKVHLSNNIYSLYHSTKNPFNLHIVMKDGIVFMGTSLTDIEQINAGTFKGNLNKQQKDLLMNSNISMFLSPKVLHDKMPVSELGEISEYVLGNSGNIYLRSSGIKGNYLSGEFIADVPPNQENALKYFFSLFNNMTKKL